MGGAVYPPPVVPGRAAEAVGSAAGALPAWAVAAGAPQAPSSRANPRHTSRAAGGICGTAVPSPPGRGGCGRCSPLPAAGGGPGQLLCLLYDQTRPGFKPFGQSRMGRKRPPGGTETLHAARRLRGLRPGEVPGPGPVFRPSGAGVRLSGRRGIQVAGRVSDPCGWRACAPAGRRSAAHRTGSAKPPARWGRRPRSGGWCAPHGRPGEPGGPPHR